MAAEADASRKLVVLALANIHAGEVDGKEALLMLARDLALGADKSLLENLVIVFAPVLNAAGNGKLGPHRPAQAGRPPAGTAAKPRALDLTPHSATMKAREAR